MIAKALAQQTPIIILDEPTVGLDPNQIIEIRSLIKMLGKHHTVILSSHILPELSLVATKYGIISKGKLLQEITAEQMDAGEIMIRKGKKVHHKVVVK